MRTQENNSACVGARVRSALKWVVCASAAALVMVAPGRAAEFASVPEALDCRFTLGVLLDGVAAIRALGIKASQVGDLNWSEQDFDEAAQAEAVLSMVKVDPGAAVSQDSFDAQKACVVTATKLRHGLHADAVRARREVLAQQRAERVGAAIRPVRDQPSQ